MSAEKANIEYDMLCRLKNGEEGAFLWLYDNYHVLLYNYIFHFVKSVPVAEDLLQDVFIKIWRARERIDPVRGAKAYCYRVARNAVYSFLSSMARQKELEAEFLNVSGVLSAPDHLSETEQEQLEMLLYNTINDLPEKRKIVFRSCRIEGKSYDEVADQLGISRNTVKEHLVLAIKFIKKRMEEQLRGKPILLILSLLLRF